MMVMITMLPKLITSFSKSRLIMKWYVATICVELFYITVFLLSPNGIGHYDVLLLIATPFIAVFLAGIMVHAVAYRCDDFKMIDAVYLIVIAWLAGLAGVIDQRLFIFTITIWTLFVPLLGYMYARIKR
jgi:hypothetical protein